MKNDNVLYNQNDNNKNSKMITFTPWKIITTSTLENDNIQAFKNDNIYNWKMIISSTLENDNILSFFSKMITIRVLKFMLSFGVII